MLKFIFRMLLTRQKRANFFVFKWLALPTWRWWRIHTPPINPVKIIVGLIATFALFGCVADDTPINIGEGKSSSSSSSSSSGKPGNTNAPAETCEEPISYTSSPMRRLNKIEISNAINDVFGTGGELVKIEKRLSYGEFGFATSNTHLDFSYNWMAQYLDTAKDVAKVISENSDFARVCEPDDESCFTNELNRAGKLLFRRDLEIAEIEKLLEMKNKLDQRFPAQNLGSRAVIMTLITSPHFMFNAPTQETEIERPLSGKELAERLATTLWKSVPDVELLNIAESGELNQFTVLESQIERMMEDEKFHRFTDYFVEKWLNFSSLYNRSDLSPSTRDLDWEALARDLQTETKLFFRHVVKNNLPIEELYNAPYTFLNKRVAEHYSVPADGLDNSTFSQYNLAEHTTKKGIVSHTTSLYVPSYKDKFSTSLRGSRLLDKFLCREYYGFPHESVDEFIEEHSAKNERQLTQALMDDPACGSCHGLMDAFALVFDNYDAFGKERALDDDGNPVDTSVTMKTWHFIDVDTGVVTKDREFIGADDFIHQFIDTGDFQSCFGYKFLSYSIGRRANQARR